MQDLQRALGLLTVLPVRPRWDEQTVAGRAMAWYPLVGLVIGGLLALLALLLRLVPGFGPGALLPAALVLTAWVGLTGALHLDGWADCCDALFVPTERGRRLEILKDPRLGSFGGVGLVILLLLKLTALQTVLGRPAGPLLLVTVPALARWTVVIAAAAFPPARPDGMAVLFRRGIGRRELAIATITAAAAALLLHWTGLALWCVAAILMYGLARIASARLGGLTGDVYGATVELVETGLLIAGALLI